MEINGLNQTSIVYVSWYLSKKQCRQGFMLIKEDKGIKRIH